MTAERKRAAAVGRPGDAHCPKCNKVLEWVGSGPGYLNSEQWDATKAGEYFTTCADAQCGGRRHLSNGNVYFGEIEPPKVQTRAELESELAALRRRVEEMETALRDCADAMYADNPADGWKEIIDNARAALSPSPPAEEHD